MFPELPDASMDTRKPIASLREANAALKSAGKTAPANFQNDGRAFRLRQQMFVRAFENLSADVPALQDEPRGFWLLLEPAVTSSPARRVK
jgi:hypothetical protein